MKILAKIYQQNLDCRTESIEIGISEHRTLSSGSIEKKLITTMKGANKEKSFNNLSLNLQQGNLCQTELSDGSNVDFKQHGKMFQQIDLQR